MNNAERLLGAEYYCAGGFSGVVAEEIDERAATSAFGDVIDFDPVTMPQRVLEGAALVTQLLGASNESEQQAMERAAIFSWQVATIIYGQNSVGMRLPDSLLEKCQTGSHFTDDELEQFRDKVRLDTISYLMLNEHVAELIEQYSPQIDITEGAVYADRVREVFAFMLICAERYQLHRSS